MTTGIKHTINSKNNSETEESILNIFDEHKQLIEKSKNLSNKIIHMINTIMDSYQKGGKTIIIGNGGSSSDSSHIAAEFTGILKIPAVSLNNVTSITSIANDFGYENIFSNQLESIASNKDVLIAISTSGNSRNIIKAVELAKSKNIKVIGLTGKTGGKLRHLLNKEDILIEVDSINTQRIQEIHLIIGHIIFEIIRHHISQENK